MLRKHRLVRGLGDELTLIELTLIELNVLADCLARRLKHVEYTVAYRNWTAHWVWNIDARVFWKKLTEQPNVFWLTFYNCFYRIQDFTIHCNHDIKIVKVFFSQHTRLWSQPDSSSNRCPKHWPRRYPPLAVWTYAGRLNP